MKLIKKLPTMHVYNIINNKKWNLKRRNFLNE